MEICVYQKDTFEEVIIENITDFSSINRLMKVNECEKENLLCSCTFVSLIQISRPNVFVLKYYKPNECNNATLNGIPIKIK